MPTKVITAPTEEPISLTEAKAHLRVDFDDDNPYITALISVARDYAEGFQRRSLAPQTLELILPGFPPSISLKRGPVNQITSVTYTAPDGTPQTLPSASYTLTSNDELIPTVGNSWPSTIGVGDAVKVLYTAGYATVPHATKQAMLLLIGHWYENREAVVIGKAPAALPMAVDSLLWMDRTW